MGWVFQGKNSDDKSVLQSVNNTNTKQRKR